MCSSPLYQKRNLEKVDFLLKTGQVCTSLFFIDKGFCKSYYEVNGDIKNTGFFFENEIATNVTSFGFGQKSEYNIVACEPMTVIIFNKEKLFEIAQKTLEVETLGRCCVRVYAANQEELSKIFQLFSAQKRLEYIEENKPELLQRVSLSQLATFLGVTRETLSRIRRKRTSK